jgi:hypothetical protein
VGGKEEEGEMEGKIGRETVCLQGEELVGGEALSR